MLDIQLGGIHCKISLLFPAVLLLLLVGDTSGIACYSVLAAVAHELGHLLVLHAFDRYTVKSISVSFYGMRLSDLTVERLPTVKSIFVFAAGPLVNAVVSMLVVLTGGELVVSLIHALLAVMNCLPILPLDGGQIVWCVLRHFLNAEKADRWMRAISMTTWCVMMAAGIVMLIVTERNFTLLFTAIYVGACMLFYKGN